MVCAEKMAAPEKDVVCSEKVELPDRISSAIWKPLTIVTIYLWFLRGWYNTFKAQGTASIFSEVWIECPLVFSCIYIVTIFTLMRVMKDREVPQLKNSILTYNIYQTVLNAWCVASFIKEVVSQGMNVWGNTFDPERDFNLGFLIWVHYNNKYVELLDTVFMALRKKNKQISFLHMYHHVLLIWSWFVVCRIMPGGDAYFGALVNSFIHVLMYSYYGLALLKVKTPWKRQLTNLQMIQFCACFAQSAYLISKGQSVLLASIQMFVMTNMLVLFGNFYHKQYVKKPQVPAKEA